MALFTGMIRRLLWLVVLGLVGSAVAQWWRERQAPDAPAAPEWPPIDTPSSRSTAPSAGTATEADTGAPTSEAPDSTGNDQPEVASNDADTADTAEPAAEVSPPAAESAPSAADTPVGTASFVNALVDAPEARSAGGDGAAWVDPDADGACPISHPIKANDNSGIFHVPGGRFYDRTKAERCYVDADAATADGYRQAKS